ARQTLNEVVAEANKQGDKEVYRFDFTPQTGSLKFGASWHPSKWQHQKMAAELTAYLRELMQWF
ncbi:MAG: lipase, partial [Prevotella sp.]|nr:lipase [Prevotella sp.]